MSVMILRYYRYHQAGFQLFHSIPFSFSAFSVRVAEMFYPPSFRGGYLGQIQWLWAKARAHPEWVASSLQDPCWWQWLPHRCQLRIRSNFGVQYLARGYFGFGFQLALGFFSFMLGVGDIPVSSLSLVGISIKNHNIFDQTVFMLNITI